MLEAPRDRHLAGGPSPGSGGSADPPRRHLLALLGLGLPGLLLARRGTAAETLLVEDWSASPVGTRGIPVGWRGQSWGRPAYDLTVEADGAERVLHLRSREEATTISKPLPGRLDLGQTPLLRWRWKVTVLPVGGDSRRKATDDQAVQLYVVWPRFPEGLRSRIIGYVWDTTAPVGTIVPSEWATTVTYVVLRSGPAELGRWCDEQRDVRDDYRRIYHEEPDHPGGVSLGVDSNDTRSSAESYVGTIRFAAR